MKQIIRDELFEVVVSFRFAPGYKREGTHESSFVREFSVQLWGVNQRTTEAEEVTDS
jgi:hypothetical protein